MPEHATARRRWLRCALGAAGSVPLSAALARGTDERGASAALLEKSDPRRLYWVSPAEPFRRHSTGALSQVAVAPNPPLTSLTEPGVRAGAGEFAFERTSDPLNPGRAAFRHRLSPAFPSWAGSGASNPTWRSEVTAPGQDSGFTILRGQAYWIAYAIKPEPDVLDGQSAASIFDLHAADGSRNRGPSPISLLIGRRRLTLLRSWNDEYMGDKPLRESEQLSASSSQWNYLVFQVRLHWHESRDPFLRVWQAVGDEAPRKVLDLSGPIGYNEPAPTTAQKFGLYRWDPWGRDTSATAYTKGLYVFKDAPGGRALDERAMVALLRSI